MKIARRACVIQGGVDLSYQREFDEFYMSE